MIILVNPIMLIIEPKMVRDGFGFGFMFDLSVGLIQRYHGCGILDH